MPVTSRRGTTRWPASDDYNKQLARGALGNRELARRGDVLLASRTQKIKIKVRRKGVCSVFAFVAII